MKIRGRCLGVTPGKGNALVVTVMNELDGEPHEIDARCWGDNITSEARRLKHGDVVEIEGRLETKSWRKPGTDGSLPAMRFTNFNAHAIDRMGNEPRGNPPPEVDDSDIPF